MPTRMNRNRIQLPDLDSGVIQYHSILWEGDGGGMKWKKGKILGRKSFTWKCRPPSPR